MYTYRFHREDMQEGRRLGPLFPSVLKLRLEPQVFTCTVKWLKAETHASQPMPVQCAALDEAALERMLVHSKRDWTERSVFHVSEISQQVWQIPFED